MKSKTFKWFIIGIILVLLGIGVYVKYSGIPYTPQDTTVESQSGTDK